VSSTTDSSCIISRPVLPGKEYSFVPAQVQYDTFITVYMSDCDFYPRVRAAGFKTLDYPNVRPFREIAD
jgi:hypothetical protein